MPGPYHDVDCPICSSRMIVLGSGGRTVTTCRNGHRFVRGRRQRRPLRWPQPGPFLALSISLLLIVLFVAARRWPGELPFIHAG